MTEDRDDLERELRARFDRGDLHGVATLAVERYGPEILGFLFAVMRNEDDANEVFAELATDLWKDLPGFQWRSSLRTWAYVIARHRMSAFSHDPKRRPARNQPLSPEIEEIAERVRTTTVKHLRTEVKQGVAKLRAQLPPDDQTLLILRIDRDLPWRDVAEVMEVDEPALRKRFERVKARLRVLAREEKLL